jgi:hypothetical protein
MIIASPTAAAGLSTDPTAQSVRSFIAPAARLESRAQAKPATGKLDLARMYPSIFSSPAQQSAFAARSARAMTTLASGAAAAAALIIGVLNHR